LLQRGRLDELSNVARDDLVRRVSENRTNLRARLASESRTLGPAHPRIQELNAQLATLERELRLAAGNVARGLENDAQIARTRVDNLLAAIEQQKQQVGGTSGDQVKRREYEMEAKLLKEQLEANTTKYREALARQQSESTPADARVISRAAVPDRPTFPKVIPILLFATIGALVLAVSGVIAGELLSGRALIQVQQDLAALRRAPAGSGRRAQAGEDKVDGDGEEDVLAAPRQRARSDALDPATARVLAALSKMHTSAYGARVLVCAPGGRCDPGAGIEPLARALSRERRTVLIDFSGRAMAGMAGLSELLEGSAGFADVIHRDGASRMHLIGLGAGAAGASAELDDAIDALSQTYEFIVLVAPQEDDAGLALQLAPAVDVAVLAVETAVAGEEAVALQKLLLEAGAGRAIQLVAPRSGGDDTPDLRASRDAA